MFLTFGSLNTKRGWEERGEEGKKGRGGEQLAYKNYKN
jgi:hypothetical protein